MIYPLTIILLLTFINQCSSFLSNICTAPFICKARAALIENDDGNLFKNESYTYEGMPSGIDAVASQALQGLASALSAGETRLKVDILVPGLNSRLENSAPFNKGLLLSFLKSLLPAFGGLGSIKVLFSSAGDAAMAEKTFKGMGWRKPDAVTFRSLSVKSIDENDEAVVIVNPTNSVGDPVILEVEKVAMQLPKSFIVLLNADLGEKVALGIIERDRRSNLLDSFKQAYYFRNLYFMSRPDLVPVERGGLVCQWGRGWGVYVTDGRQENMGSGSLNRFMNMAVYRRTGSDPTAENPPHFYLIKKFSEEPSREEISACIDSSSRIIDQIRIVSEELKANEVLSYEEATKILGQAAFDGSNAIKPQKIINAISLLEEHNKNGRKERKQALMEDNRKRDFEELTRGAGFWRLTFLYKEDKSNVKGEPKKGSISYIPIHAVQEMGNNGAYANGIYAFGIPLVKFSGWLDWNEVTSRLTFGVDTCQVLGLSIPMPPQKSKGVPGFKMFAIVGGPRGYIIGRGNTGGIALWRRVDSI